MSKLARQVARRLRGRNRAGHELTLALHLENGPTLERFVTLSQPVQNVGELRQHLKGLLGQLRITSGIQSIVISVSDLVTPQPFQPSLFDDHRQQAGQLQDVLKHLARRYGDNIFYRVTVTDPDSLVPENRYRIHGVDFA